MSVVIDVTIERLQFRKIYNIFFSGIRMSELEVFVGDRPFLIETSALRMVYNGEISPDAFYLDERIDYGFPLIEDFCERNSLILNRDVNEKIIDPRHFKSAIYLTSGFDSSKFSDGIKIRVRSHSSSPRG